MSTSSSTDLSMRKAELFAQLRRVQPAKIEDVPVPTKTVRKCSTCKQEGHTKRSCEFNTRTLNYLTTAMSWTPWSEKSKDIPFKSTKPGEGDGEQKMSHELDTPLFGQNSSYDMQPTLNGVKTKCEIKKLDTDNSFNTGKHGRDILRPIKMRHTTLLAFISTLATSRLFTTEERKKMAYVADASPDELAVGTLQILKEICAILNLKKKTIRSSLPTVPFTTYGQTQDIPIDLYYTICQKLGLEFPSEFASHIEKIHVLEKMAHIYIDEPNKFMEDLHSLVGKLFADIKLIIVHEEKGYTILEDSARIQFQRITRGNPRFKVV